MGLLSLTNKHNDVAIQQACRVARSHGAYRLRIIRELLKRQAPEQEQFDFIAEHPLIRSLSDYGQLESPRSVSRGRWKTSIGSSTRRPRGSISSTWPRAASSEKHGMCCSLGRRAR
jgi:hypothetical protein